MAASDVNLPKDMRDAIEACYERCEALVNNFATNIDAQPKPAAIYHYTDSAGLLGILQSRKIWLTDIFGLNDPSELRHGVKHACEVLAAQAQHGHPAARFFAEKFNAVMSGGVEASAQFFVACFSRDKDDLGQWRAYGDNGRGFAIGFDSNLLEDAFIGQTDEEGNAVFPITYDDASLCDIHRELVREVLPLIEMPKGRRLDNAVIGEFMKELSVGLSVCVIRAAIFFKHEAYKNEQERRFLKLHRMDQPVDKLKYRTRRHSLIRFTDFGWCTNDHQALREIVIGPAADTTAAQSLVQDCLRVGGVDPNTITVHQSKIPYRGT